MIDKSNWKWDKRNNNELRENLRIRKTLLNDSYESIQNSTQKVMQILTVLYNGWKSKDLSVIKKIEYSVFHSFLTDEYVTFFENPNYNNITIDATSPKSFLRDKKPRDGFQKKTADLYATYLGYAGVLGMLNNPPVSLARCFLLEEFGIDNLLVLLKKEAKNITDTNADIQEAKQKEFREITEDDILKYLYPKQVNQNKISETTNHMLEQVITRIETINRNQNDLNSLGNLASNDADFIASILKQNPKDFKEVIFNFLGQNIKEENIKELISTPNTTLSNTFNEIIDSKKLSLSLIEKINLFLNRKYVDDYKWWHRAIITSALTLSVIEYWDINKVKLLKQLAERNDEQIVYERAIIGLTLSIISSFGGKKFNITIEIIKSLKGSNKVIFETLNFLLGNTNDYDLLNPVSTNPFYIAFKESSKEFIFKENYQYFEPYYSNSSFLSLNENLKIREKELNDIFLALNHSTSLNYQEKLVVFAHFDKLDLWQINALKQVLNQEKESYRQIFENSIHALSFNKLKYGRPISEFLTTLDNFKNYSVTLKTKLASINQINLSKELFNYFPYVGYIELIDEQTIVNSNLLKSRKNLLMLASYYELKSYKQNNDFFTIKYSRKAIFYYKKAQLIKDDFNLFLDIERCLIYLASRKSNKNDLIDIATANVHYFNKNRPKFNNEQTATLLSSRGSCFYEKARIENFNNEETLSIAVSLYSQSFTLDKKIESIDMRSICLASLGDIDKNINILNNAIKSYYGLINTIKAKSLSESSSLIHSVKQNYDQKTANVIKNKLLIEDYSDKIIIAINGICSCVKIIAETKNDISTYYEAHKHLLALLKQEISVVEKTSDLFISDCLALFEIKIGELSNNEKMYQSAINRLENDLLFKISGSTLGLLGWCYLVLEKTKKSKETYLKALNQEEDESYFMGLAHCELILENKKEAIENYKMSLELWNCSEDFFDDFDDDFKHIESQGVLEKTYKSIKQELREYCVSKNE